MHRIVAATLLVCLALGLAGCVVTSKMVETTQDIRCSHDPNQSCGTIHAVERELTADFFSEFDAYMKLMKGGI